MIWVCIYLIIGIMFSEFAYFGHRRRYGTKMKPAIWIAGIFAWPFMLYFGRKKK